MLILFALSTSKLMSQESYIYKQSPELDKFVGTWQFESGDTVVIIAFEKAKYKLEELNEYTKEVYCDILVGWHNFNIKGKEVQNSIKSRSKNYSYKENKHTIMGIYNELDFVRILHFRDKPNGKEVCTGKLFYLPNETQLHLKLSDRRAQSILNEKDLDKALLPLNMVLSPKE
jgi:hypothetical protein